MGNDMQTSSILDLGPCTITFTLLQLGAKILTDLRSLRRHVRSGFDDLEVDSMVKIFVGRIVIP